MIACLIPARFNSSRFPGKLLALARGKTVLQRTFESASHCFDKEQIFVATDSEPIASHIEALGGQVIWTSPDCINGTDRIAQAVEKTASLDQAEIILNLQGDHPCTDPATIKAVVTALQSDPNCAMSTAAAPIRSLEDFLSPHIVKVVTDQNRNALYFSRSPIPYGKEGLPKNALQHIGLYCFQRDFLLKFAKLKNTPLQMQEDLEQLRALETGAQIKVAIVNEVALGVDTPGDLVKLEEFLCR
jgi:3-deoxy-manno-octulosonate cytidylyltransferase (CMP-KDO synthetase)